MKRYYGRTRQRLLLAALGLLCIGKRETTRAAEDAETRAVAERVETLRRAMIDPTEPALRELCSPRLHSLVRRQLISIL